MMEWSGLQTYVKKMSGTGKRSPLKVSGSVALFAGAGGFVTIGLLGLLTEMTTVLWLMAPFGASCVLAFVLWDAPLSQPRNIIGGHFISSLVGILLYQLGGNSIWLVALGVGLAIALMHVTKTTHPPAGADPIVVMVAGCGWEYLVSPVLIGAVAVVGVALLFNNLHKTRQYPVFWY